MEEAGLLKQLDNEVKIKGIWGKDEIRGKISAKIQQAEQAEKKARVKELRLYDFFSVKLHGIPHPCVIFRLEGDVIWGLVTSSKEGIHTTVKIEGSRLLEGGWWTSTVICQSKEHCLSNWLGVFESPESVKSGVKAVRELFKTVLK